MSIEVEVEDGCLHFRIQDDGPGFDPAAVTRGHGLSGMERRAGEAGGVVVVVDSGPGRGTSVICSVPMA